jgi:hypothetical protein
MNDNRARNITEARAWARIGIACHAVSMVAPAVAMLGRDWVKVALVACTAFQGMAFWAWLRVNAAVAERKGPRG